jgi:hypothetical protein
MKKKKNFFKPIIQIKKDKEKKQNKMVIIK